MDLEFLTPKQCQKKFDISRRTFFNWLKQGKFETKYIPSPQGGGHKGRQLLVRPSAQTSEKINLERYRVNRGEPGNSVVIELRNGLPVGMTEDEKSAAAVVDGLIRDRKAFSYQRQELIDQILKPRPLDSDQTSLISDPEAPGPGNLPAFTPLKAQSGPGALTKEVHSGAYRDPQAEASVLTGTQSGPMAKASLSKDMAQGAPLNTLPAVRESWIPASAGMTKTNSKAERIANLRFALIQAFNEEIKKNHRPRTEIVRDFLSLYNTGVSHPEIVRELGTIARSTFYELLRAEEQGGIDGLVPQYGGAGASKITEHEKNLLLTLVLHQNRLKTAYAIKLAKNYLKKKRIESPSSPATLRRYVEQFKKEHFDLWELYREGEKALNDKVLPYIERDWNLLEVGEGLVADGHRLNFQVINPFTRKPCRASMVMWWDWKSAYPLGWEIMLEENIQCISSALRNAILALGKVPKWVLLDNGKAFKARIFTSEIDLAESEIMGMFARLNINTHFAQPYNAQSKPVERFFQTFSDQFERLLPSFTGSSIEDKPAWIKRNEKLALSVHNPWVPEIHEVDDLIHRWRDYYADQSHRGRDGLKPGEIFAAGKGPGVDPAQLTYLMMPREIKTIYRNGINFLGHNWYHEALYGLRDRVLIKYSLSDLSRIYVFHKNEFLCAATPVEKVHPMASESGTPKDMEEVKRQIAQKRSLKKQTVKLHKLLGSKSAEALPWKEIVQEIPNVVETIEKIEAEKLSRASNTSPFIDNPADSVPAPAPREADQTASPDEPRRPWFADEYERYRWVMQQDRISQDDRDFVDDFRARSLLYKNTVFTDQKALDRKIINPRKEVSDERCLCNGS